MKSKCGGTRIEEKKNENCLIQNMTRQKVLIYNRTGCKTSKSKSDELKNFQFKN